MMENYQQELNRNIEFIKLADTKAAWIGTVLFAMVGLWVAKSSRIFEGENNLLYSYVPVAAGLAAAYCSYQLVRVYLPKLKAKNKTKSSVIYYGDISTMDLKKYKKTRLKLSGKALLDAYLDQIYVTSSIADKKMKHVRLALLGFGVFALLTAVFFYFVYAQGVR